VKEDDFDPDAHYETKVKAGEVWQLGEHRLMCGDSTDADAVAKLMNGERADLWLTDPPYNVDYSSKNEYLNKLDGGNRIETDIEHDKMSDADFDQFLRNAFGAAESVMKEGASFYVWTAQGHAMTDISKALDANGLYFRQQLIWVKNMFVLGRSDYHGKHEPCFYGWKAGAAHHWYSDRSQTTVLNFDKPQKSDLHPTMKPVPLFGYQVGNSTKEGDIVIDTFGGSGTTMIACEQLGRKCRMMELDPHYCTVIIARWEKLTGQKAIKL
jgi:site-specific DNA-methyltransferase (adenine-specific)